MESISQQLLPYLWPGERLDRGLNWLREHLGLAVANSNLQALPTLDELSESVLRSSSKANFSLQEIAVTSDKVRWALRNSAPLLVPIADRICIVRRCRRTNAQVVAADGTLQWVPLQWLESAVLESVAKPDFAEQPSSLDPAFAAALETIHRSERSCILGWALTPQSGRLQTSLMNALTPLAGRFLGVLGLHTVQYGMWIASWIAFAAMVMQIHEGWPPVLLWVLALVTSVLMLPLESAWQDDLTRRIGIRVKQTLMNQALDADKNRVRASGIGRMLAQSLEANQLDALASQGGIAVLLAGLELMMALILVFWWQGIAVLSLGYLAFCLGLLWLCRRYFAGVVRWREAASQVTSAHAEAMVGHRARKTLLGRHAWNDVEDRLLVGYHNATAGLDRIAVWLGTVHRWWGVFGIMLVLLTLFIGRGVNAPVQAAALVGFVILTHASLHVAATGMARVLQALVIYRGFNQTAQSNTAVAGIASPALVSSDSGADTALRAKGVRYTHPMAAEPVLAACDLALEAGGRMLLTGASGSGKSTLGAVLSGRLQPDSGSILSHGVDCHIAGLDYWRHLVSYVPQANVNHLVTDSLAFNLLMGRRWPPRRDDLTEAENVARDLGLGPLLERMPAGIMQVVGESGWRLSQGEQVRVYAARALLQGSSTIIVDELLGPLDPHTANEVLQAIDARVNRLLLIAHV